MADRYAELGFDVLIGTDHTDRGPDAEFTFDYSDVEFPGIILDGAELSANHHVNHIESANKSIKQINHPMRYDDSIEDLRRLSDRIGADLIETTDHGKKFGEYPSPADVIADTDLCPTVTSDAHSTSAIGDGYVLIEVADRSGDGVIEALKNGTYAIGGTVW